MPTLDSRSSSYVLGIADIGLMAGYGNVKGSMASKPVAWPSPFSIVELPLLPKGSGGTAGGVNSVGQIVGTVAVSKRRFTQLTAVVWTLP